MHAPKLRSVLASLAVALLLGASVRIVGISDNSRPPALLGRFAIPAPAAPSHPVAAAHPARTEAVAETEESDAGPGGDEFLYRIRLFPRRRIPRGARAHAFAQAMRLRAPREFLPSRRTALAADSAQQWTSIGPQPITQGFSGRVTALAVDPHDNNTVYLGGAEGGVWKTTDGGSTWQSLTDFQPTLAIGSLAIDPSNSSVIYAGTGEDNDNADAYNGMGILKSTDAGQTWTLSGGDTFDQQDIGSLAICPSNTQVILAGSPNGLYRSADGGLNWTSVMPDEATSVLFDPNDSSVAYAGLVNDGDPTGIYKSTDAGKTWNIVNGLGTTAIVFPDSTFRIALAASPSVAGTWYAGIFAWPVSGTTTPLTALYKTSNSGGAWKQIGTTAYCQTQCWYNDVIAVSPTNPKLLLGGGVNLQVSTDGGSTWLDAAPATLHVDQHAIAFTPDGTEVYVGNDGGAWQSPTANLDYAWVDLNTTLALTQFYHGISMAPGNPAVAFGGTQDNGGLGFLNQTWTRVGCGDGAATAIDPVNPQNVYIVCAGTPGDLVFLLRNKDGGSGPFETITYDIPEGVPFVPYIAIDPNNPQTLYLTGNQHIYQSTNSGSAWTAISPDVTNDELWACTIAVAPSDSNTVYSGSCDGEAMVTNSALSGSAATWRNISAGLGGAAITHMVVDPASSQKVYATSSGFQDGHVFMTENGGQTWTDITGNLPDISVNDLIIDPDIPGTLYAATDMGVFWTNTTGQVWSALGTGLPKAAVLSLAFDGATRTLRAATHGRSVWDLLVPTDGLNLIPAVSSIAPAQIAVNAAHVTIAVTGRNFAAGSQIYWNGQARPSTVASSTALTATPTAADLSADNLATVAVFTPGPGGGMSAPYYVKVGPDPAVFPDAVLNAASYKEGVTPGAIVSVFGVNLAAGTSGFDKLPLPGALAGSSLAVTDSSAGFTGAAPLFFTAAGQMNVQIPWEVSPGDFASFTPKFQGASGAPLSVQVRYFAPGIFTANQSGTGQGAITNAVTNRLAAPASKYPNAAPVPRGGYLSIYCTGLGQVTDPPKDGAAAPTDQLVYTFTQPLVYIGTVQGTVTFSGLAPGYVGLYQVNVQIPMNSPVGDAVPLTITDGYGDTSNVVTVAIQ